MIPLSISQYELAQATLNRRFSRLLYETAINVSPGDPDLIALRIAVRDHDLLEIGRLVDKMMTDYERENCEPLEDIKL